MADRKHPSSPWENPTWVLTVMHFPNERELLDHVASGNGTMLTDGAAWRTRRLNAVRQGIVAGNTLGALYWLAKSPWRIPEPSLAKAIHITDRFAYETKYRNGTPMPRGRTEVRRCFDAMRPVAHLWAAQRLLPHPARAEEALIRAEGSHSTLLGLARSIQQWAINWRPSRTRQHQPLLGEKPWLVPDSVALVSVGRSLEPDWLLKALDSYKHKAT